MLDDFGNELEEIKREIVESRSLSIKTNNLINGLTAHVNSIAKRQQSYERQLRWNSVAAYVATVTVLLICGKVIVDARVESIRSSTKDQRETVTRLTTEVSRLRKLEESRNRNGQRAAELYQLVRGRKHVELLKRYNEVEELNLTKTEQALFEGARESARAQLSIRRYSEGLDHVRTKRWHEAEQALRQALTYRPDSAHSNNAQLQLAKALRSLGRQKDAVPILTKLSESSPDREIMDDATLMLAESQVDLNAYADAKATLRTYIRRFPNSPTVYTVRRRLAELSLRR